MRKFLPAKKIISRVYFIRNSKVMLDKDLAELYEKETKALKPSGSSRYRLAKD